MRCLALLGFACLWLVPSAAAADRSWAQPQIEAVVEAGLLADSVAGFKPQKPLTQRALAAALETLSLAAAEPVDYRYPAVAPGRAVTIRELDAARRLPRPRRFRAPHTAALHNAGVAAKTGVGTETVGRLLGLRVNHLPPRTPSTRPERPGHARRGRVLPRAPARAVGLGAGADPVDGRAQLVLPQVTGTQQRLLRRAVSFVGWPCVWGGTSEASQQLWDGKQVPGGFDCSGFVWRVFKLEPFPGASALATVLRGRTTFEMSAEVPPAQRIRKIESLQSGDLIFHGAKGPKSKPAQIDHAAIYLGGGWFVHSSGNGTTLHPFEGWYRDRFAWARRPLREAGLA
jgi:cell wall-associated NlpC family hydrolase